VRVDGDAMEDRGKTAIVYGVGMLEQTCPGNREFNRALASLLEKP